MRNKHIILKKYYLYELLALLSESYHITKTNRTDSKNFCYRCSKFNHLKKWWSIIEVQICNGVPTGASVLVRNAETKKDDCLHKNIDINELYDLVAG